MHSKHKLLSWQTTPETLKIIILNHRYLSLFIISQSTVGKLCSLFICHCMLLCKTRLLFTYVPFPYQLVAQKLSPFQRDSYAHFFTQQPSIIIACKLGCMRRITSVGYLNVLLPGAQPRLKSWGGPRFGSQHRGAWDPRPAKGRAECWVREGVASSRCRDPGI